MLQHAHLLGDTSASTPPPSQTLPFALPGAQGTAGTRVVTSLASWQRMGGSDGQG